MFRIVLFAGAVMLGLSAAPAQMTVVGDLSVPGIALGGSQAMAQRASDPRYQPGNSACRDGAGRRC